MLHETSNTACGPLGHAHRPGSGHCPVCGASRAGYAAVGQSSVECAVQLVDGGGFEPQRKTVVVRGRLTVARRGDHQPRAIVIPHIALKAVDVDVRGRRRTQNAEDGVIELAAGSEVVGAEEEVGEHINLVQIFSYLQIRRRDLYKALL